MKGLMVVGLAHGAGEGSVAAGCAAVLKRAGTAAHAKKILEYDLTASPIIAARHEGDTINPSAVIADIRTDDADAALVVAAPGGLMATLTHSATLRDLVGDLHWPVVLAARANPEATNLVRLSLAAARSARLTVAAVVLTNWPEEPDTIQNDERKLLGQVAGCTVLTLAESPSARGADVEYWPVGEWLDAIPPEPEPAPVRPTAPRVSSVAIPTPAAPPPPSSGELGLEAFAGWDPRPTGDPRHTPRPRMMEALLEIAAAEGPLRASRAYTLYNRASGGKKLTGAARQPLVSALRWLGQEDKVVLVEQGDDLIVRTPDQPEVRLRDLGDRTLEEVPLDEIAELMRRLGRASDLKRAVLNTYGLVRLTQRADDYLNLAIGLL